MVHFLLPVIYTTRGLVLYLNWTHLFQSFVPSFTNICPFSVILKHKLGMGEVSSDHQSTFHWHCQLLGLYVSELQTLLMHQVLEEHHSLILIIIHAQFSRRSSIPFFMLWPMASICPWLAACHGWDISVPVIWLFYLSLLHSAGLKSSLLGFHRKPGMGDICRCHLGTIHWHCQVSLVM